MAVNPIIFDLKYTPYSLKREYIKELDIDRINNLCYNAKRIELYRNVRLCGCFSCHYRLTGSSKTFQCSYRLMQTCPGFFAYFEKPDRVTVRFFAVKSKCKVAPYKIQSSAWLFFSRLRFTMLVKEG